MQRPFGVFYSGKFHQHLREPCGKDGYRIKDYIQYVQRHQKQTVENEVIIFRNALDFSNTHVRDCMTPRNEIVAVDIECLRTRRLPLL